QLRKAKLHVEKAIKEKKIFAVQGPYPVIRRLLRARGWVERKLPRNGKQPKQQPGSQKKRQLEKKASGGDGGELEEAVLNPRDGAQPSPGTSEPLHHPRPHKKKNKGEGEDEDKKEDKKQRSEDSDDIHDLMSFLVQDQVPNFLWTIRLSIIDQELLQRIEVVNRYPRLHALCTKVGAQRPRGGGTRGGGVQHGLTSFSKQEGLCQSLQNLSWFEQVDLNTFFPRCYRLGNMEEQEAFIEDFRLTAARSLLKLALEKVEDRLVGTEQPPKSNQVPGDHVSHPMPSAAQPGSPLYPHLVEEALEVCEQHLGVLGHQDIDRETPSPCRTCIAWDRFLQEYYHVAHEGARLVLSREQQEQCQDVLQRLGEQLPQLSIEGNLNVWILKPSAKSRGRGKAGGSTGHTRPHGEGIPPSLCCPGIVCATRLEEVLELSRSCTAPSARVCEWVVQKYVEQPLTIFDTKFDIRQWFLVTDWKPLTRVMVPGMKAAILNALRCAQDQVGSRKGSFELFGADFLIGEDCQPWLLEINSCPTMSPSSAVTRRLCANVQRDTLRLVLDRKDNPTCPIGAFELLYKEVGWGLGAATPQAPRAPTPLRVSLQAAVPTCLHVGLKLMVEGCSLKKP
ncbi:TTLL3 monoglycylase, partial [Mohoua ochrocephala]|nr:TTLL3 monoglycylase [Mohoua ochrocephala]